MNKEKNIKKINEDINNYIKQSVNLANNANIMELLYFIYSLHFLRLSRPSDYAGTSYNPKLIQLSNQQFEEAIKYIIQILAKYSKSEIVEENNRIVFNQDIIQQILKNANNINSKYETVAMINLFDIKENDNSFEIDLDSLKNNPKLKSFFDYFIRIDIDNDLKKTQKSDRDIFLQAYKEEFKNYDDLFEITFGITIDNFCSVIVKLTDYVINNINKNVVNFAKLSNGNIDVLHYKSVLWGAFSFVVDKGQIQKDFNEKELNLINKLTFSSNEYNENELRFHYITRKPLIERDESYFISPTLLLDSLYTNTHYTLLEKSDIKEEYKKRYSNIFLDKILEIATDFGYNEVERELELYEGKQQIGDIDLILKNADNHYLLIEAKNHALQMAVYFKDIQATNKHLLYLQEKWEKKVIARNNHLKEYFSNYNINENFNYLIVSKYPEIISHFSELFVLSVFEFEQWLKKNKPSYNFKEFHRELYDELNYNLSETDLKILNDANLLYGKLKKK